MPDDRLQIIEQRLAQATPRSWAEALLDELAPFLAATEADNEFIRHAPADLAYLVTRLKAAEAACQAIATFARGHYAWCRAERLDGPCNCGLHGVRDALATWEAAR